MVIGLGFDLVEVEKIAATLQEHGSRFEKRVFTPLELEQCAQRIDRPLALAARFAAKEACLKALGTGWAAGLNFRQVEVVRAPDGRPDLVLHGAAEELAKRKGVKRIHVSLSHQPTVAGAVVILED
jgi:holo-[acyl-carrier protein] synthase